jgi:hypothetical protein
MLVKPDSVLTHASDFTPEGVIAALTLFHRRYNFTQTIPDLLNSRNMDKVMDTDTIPFYSQAKRLYRVHRKWVKRYVDHWYPTDNDLLKDDSVIRFWNHVNTYGRHLDPCVCGLSSELFFDDNGVWPGFETTRTCKDLLDSVDFFVDKNPVTRRRQWCSSTDPYTKVKALYRMNKAICDSNPDCKGILWNINDMKPNMGLGELRSKSQLVNFLASAMFHVTAGHRLLSDNVSFFSDPEYSGTRMVDLDNNGELPRIVDVGTYVFGTFVLLFELQFTFDCISNTSMNLQSLQERPSGH